MTVLTVRVFATDPEGNVSDHFDANYEVVNKPVITAVGIAPLSAPPGVERTVTITASDPDGGALTYSAVDPATGNPVTLTPTADPNVFTIAG